jgi:lipopolysaccharide transport system permease protein
MIIEPPRKWAALNLKDLWAYRELLATLATRDLKVRYKQTELGVAWALLQPFFMMIVFTFVFGRLGKVPSEGLPYAVFALSALVPWGYFTAAMTRSSTSLVDSASLITKVYFPRLVIPLSATIAGLVDLGVSFLLLIGVMAYYRIVPTVAVIALPLFVLLALCTALGVGLWLSALNVEYRDVGHVVPFLTQLWLFLTPVVYPASLLPAKWQIVYALNPMVGVIQGFRWALFGMPLQAANLAVSAAVAITMLVTGLFYFRRMERTFADVV